MIETEVKFLITDPERLAEKLAALGAKLVQPEGHEVNLRFDHPDGSLTSTFQVLRLRKDTRFRLTYKGAGYMVGGVGARTEIEFEVSDFEAARAFLEALGFVISMAYEKYRTTYHLRNVEVVLDRTPMGDFIELEGAAAAELEDAAGEIGLDWHTRSLVSYTVLFERVKTALGLHFRDMTFENFTGVDVGADVLGLRYADPI